MQGAPRRSRGLTLIEIVVALALLALLATLALPSFGGMASRHRLIAAAETLASDLGEARFQAADSGQALHLVFQRGADWCYAVARTPDCGCARAESCQLKTVRSADLPGVVLDRALDASFDPAALASFGGGALLLDRHGGESLQISMTPLGRARLCSPTGLRGYPAC